MPAEHSPGSSLDFEEAESTSASQEVSLSPTSYTTSRLPADTTRDGDASLEFQEELGGETDNTDARASTPPGGGRAPKLGLGGRGARRTSIFPPRGERERRPSDDLGDVRGTSPPAGEARLPTPPVTPQDPALDGAAAVPSPPPTDTAAATDAGDDATTHVDVKSAAGDSTSRSAPPPPLLRQREVEKVVSLAENASQYDASFTVSVGGTPTASPTSPAVSSPRRGRRARGASKVKTLTQGFQAVERDERGMPVTKTGELQDVDRSRGDYRVPLELLSGKDRAEAEAWLKAEEEREARELAAARERERELEEQRRIREERRAKLEAEERERRMVEQQKYWGVPGGAPDAPEVDEAQVKIIPAYTLADETLTSPQRSPRSPRTGGASGPRGSGRASPIRVPFDYATTIHPAPPPSDLVFSSSKGSPAPSRGASPSGSHRAVGASARGRSPVHRRAQDTYSVTYIRGRPQATRRGRAHSACNMPARSQPNPIGNRARPPPEKPRPKAVPGYLFEALWNLEQRPGTGGHRDLDTSREIRQSLEWTREALQSGDSTISWSGGLFGLSSKDRELYSACEIALRLINELQGVKKKAAEKSGTLQKRASALQAQVNEQATLKAMADEEIATLQRRVNHAAQESKKRDQQQGRAAKTMDKQVVQLQSREREAEQRAALTLQRHRATQAQLSRALLKATTHRLLRRYYTPWVRLHTFTDTASPRRNIRVIKYNVGSANAALPSALTRIGDAESSLRLSTQGPGGAALEEALRRVRLLEEELIRVDDARQEDVKKMASYNMQVRQLATNLSKVMDEKERLEARCGEDGARVAVAATLWEMYNDRRDDIAADERAAAKDLRAMASTLARRHAAGQQEGFSLSSSSRKVPPNSSHAHLHTHAAAASAAPDVGSPPPPLPPHTTRTGSSHADPSVHRTPSGTGGGGSAKVIVCSRPRAYLGLDITSDTGGAAEGGGDAAVAHAHGVRVVGLDAAGPCARGGLQLNDILTSVAGEEVTNAEAFRRIIVRWDPSTPLEVSFTRVTERGAAIHLSTSVRPGATTEPLRGRQVVIPKADRDAAAAASGSSTLRAALKPPSLAHERQQAGRSMSPKTGGKRTPKRGASPPLAGWRS